MNFVINASVLTDALAALAKIAAPENGNVVFRGGRKLTVSSSSQVNSVQITLPVKAEGSGQFGISLDALKQAIRGRNELQCNYSNTILHLKDKRYQAELATGDAVETEAQELEFGKPIKLDADQMASLRRIVQSVALKPNSMLHGFMPCGVSLGKKRSFIATFDLTRMAFATTGELIGDAEFVLPLDMMLLITSVFIGGATLSLSRAALKVTDGTITALMAIPTLDSEFPTMAQVLSQSKVVREAKGTVAEFDKTDLISFLDNGRALANRERSEIRCVPESKGLLLSVSNTNGSVKAKFPGKLKSGFAVDFDQFDEMVRKCEDSVSAELVDDAFLKIKTKDCWLVTGLNQDG